MKEPDIIINSLEEFDSMVKKYNYRSNILYNTIHFKNINFNHLDVTSLHRLYFKVMIIESCILGLLDYANIINNDVEIHCININVCSYTKRILVHAKALYLTNVEFDGVEFTDLLSYSYTKIVIVDKDITFNSIRIQDRNVISLKESLSELNMNSTVYLIDIIDKTQYAVSFNKKLINKQNLFILKRKIKIQNLIKEDA